MFPCHAHFKVRSGLAAILISPLVSSWLVGSLCEVLIGSQAPVGGHEAGSRADIEHGASACQVISITPVSLCRNYSRGSEMGEEKTVAMLEVDLEEKDTIIRKQAVRILALEEELERVKQERDDAIRKFTNLTQPQVSQTENNTDIDSGR